MKSEKADSPCRVDNKWNDTPHCSVLDLGLRLHEILTSEWGQFIPEITKRHSPTEQWLLIIL